MKLLTTQELNVAYEFLNRVTVTGHQERNAMNVLVNRLQEVTEKPKETNSTAADTAPSQAPAAKKAPETDPLWINEDAL